MARKPAASISPAASVIDGWYVYPINDKSPAPTKWDVASLTDYLKHGFAQDHGAAGGRWRRSRQISAPSTMTMSRRSQPYVAEQMGNGAPAAAASATTAAAEPAPPLGSGDSLAVPLAVAASADPGEAIYATACSSCHEAGRAQPFGGIDLHKSTAVNSDSPQNAVNMVLYGLPASAGKVAPIMPGFAGALSQDQVVALLGYLRSHFGGKPAWGNTATLVADTLNGKTPVKVYSADGVERIPGAREFEGYAMSLTLKVNGQDHAVDADPDTPLLYVLRNDLKLNAAKFGCGLGQCGACTVIVDGKPVFSCLTPIMVLEGHEIRTVEGLGTIDKPGPMQQAFIEEQSAQCGYCIPGMMMRAQALLEKNPKASDTEIRTALEPNLCRCGTHMRILRAVKRAGELMQQAGAGGNG